MSHSRNLTRLQSRRVDEIAIKRFKLSGLVLMENAGRGCADALEQIGISGEVLICCGKGNNGGDGLVMARHLALRNHQVAVLLACAAADMAGDASTNLEILQRTSVDIRQFLTAEEIHASEDRLNRADWIVDALLGTGSRGEPRAPISDLIRLANASRARKLAIDLPSGLDCDSGQAATQTICAAHTCTLVAEKVGFQSAPAPSYLGKVHVLDIGAPREVIDLAMMDGSP